MSGSDDSVTQPARWPIGPPAPRATAWLARATWLTILILVGHWVQALLGGVGTSPVDKGNGENDTKHLFNWHPVLMVLGFVVFMAEALLAYQAPPVPSLTRESRKRLHWVCHSTALLCLLLGFLAVYRSHTLKRPVPMADFYSPHSYLGLTALGLVAAQYALGAYAYLWPRLGLPQRLALGPLHRLGGAAAWLAGLGAVASGLQEKATFLQAFEGVKGDALYSAVIRIPAFVMPLLVVLAVLVLYHQVPPARELAAGAAGAGAAGGAAEGNVGGDPSERQSLLGRGGEDVEADEFGRRRA